MYKHFLKEMSGIEIYPLVSLSIFFLFFIALIVYVFTMKKSNITELKHIPLEDSENSKNNLS
jgi:cbb3-type cytochrome oxidase subunit 3